MIITIIIMIITIVMIMIMMIIDMKNDDNNNDNDNKNRNKNQNTGSHAISNHDIDPVKSYSVIQVVEILFMVDWGLPILHNQTSWVLMTWRHMEPCHQQPWHWPCEILLCNTGSWNSIHGRQARASLFCIIKHHGCWRPGDTRSNAISNQVTEPVKSFLFNTGNWDIFFMED